MKMIFRDKTKAYEVEIKESEVSICDYETGEKVSMTRYGFQRFIEWMTEEVGLCNIEDKRDQEIDVWDMSIIDKK